MRDVTLYAKWEQETFETDGTYDIEFSANITEITYKGELADEYGWYDFTEAIVEDETYIEKTESGLLLTSVRGSRNRSVRLVGRLYGHGLFRIGSNGAFVREHCAR